MLSYFPDINSQMRLNRGRWRSVSWHRTDSLYVAPTLCTALWISLLSWCSPSHVEHDVSSDHNSPSHRICYQAREAQMQACRPLIGSWPIISAADWLFMMGCLATITLLISESGCFINWLLLWQGALWDKISFLNGKWSLLTAHCSPRHWNECFSVQCQMLNITIVYVYTQ